MFYIYPNPVKKNRIITIENTGYADYVITSIKGVFILSGFLNNEQEIIDLSKLTPGIYFITVRDLQRNQLTKILIIE